MFKDIIISAPFGNWLNFKHATSTLGTYTFKNRGGLLYRLWRMFLTLRYNRRAKAWINKLGLPNPGLASLPVPGTRKPSGLFDWLVGGVRTDADYASNIISIYGFSKQEWGDLGRMIAYTYRPLAVELNLSCPNVKHGEFLKDVVAAVDVLLAEGVPIIAKLPPVKWMGLAKPMYDYGVRMFHCCNTIPTPGGGLSGAPLKQYSLWAVQDLKSRWGDDVRVIGGGGVSSVADYRDYKNAGANHVAVGSALLNPFNMMLVNDLVQEAVTNRWEKQNGCDE